MQKPEQPINKSAEAQFVSEYLCNDFNSSVHVYQEDFLLYPLHTHG